MQNVSLATTGSLDEVMSLGKLLAQSGYFTDAKDAGQAVVKVLAGRELGFGPIASMTGIYIVKGKITLSANLIAAAIKRSGRYDYRVSWPVNPLRCSIEYFEAGKSLGISVFGIPDAEQAGLAGGDNWRKFPRNMLFARAMSNGAKWYCPDVFGGPIYTPDELGAQVDGETGEVVESTATVVQGTASWDDVESAPPPTNGDSHPESAPNVITRQQQKAMFAMARKLYPDDGKDMPQFRAWLKLQFGTEHTSELTHQQAETVLNTLDATLKESAFQPF